MQSRFLSITKPGILFANVITFIAGYFTGLRQIKQSFSSWHFLFSILGMSLIIAAGCICNNCIDRDIDLLMTRTKNRLIATGEISVIQALLLAICCFLAGSLALFFINIISFCLALIAFAVYVIVYSIWAKRHSNFGVLLGAIAGAAPPVIGYTAITNSLDIVALLLFLLLFFWQIPHFHAIAIYRLTDYQAAKIPILPLRRSMFYTKLNILLFIVVFMLTCISMVFCANKGYVYLSLISLANLYWLYVAGQGFYRTDDTKWARQIFIVSILEICFLCLLLSLNT